MINITRAILGLSLSTVFSLFLLIQSRIQQSVKMWVIFQDIYRLFFMLLIAMVLFILDKKTYKNEYKIIYLLISPLADVLGTVFLNWAFQYSPAYLVFFINLNIYTMTNIYLLVFKGVPIEYKMFFSFIIIISLVLSVGYWNRDRNPSLKFNYFMGIFYALLSNLCFVVNIFTQDYVAKAIGVPKYYIYCVPLLCIFSITVSLIFERNVTPSKNKIIDFYKTNIKYLLLCGLSGASFYIFGGKYIDAYTPIYFNIANLPSSSISGLITNLFLNKKGIMNRKSIIENTIYFTVIIIAAGMLVFK